MEKYFEEKNLYSLITNKNIKRAWDIKNYSLEKKF